jgi:DNA replication protein DnaC
MKPSEESLEATLRRLQLFGLLARVDEIRTKAWLDEVIAIEHEEKTRRSLAHRRHLAGVGAFKPLTDYDWSWPRKIDRALVEELFTLDFLREGSNVILLGPNGVGKTLLLKNLADTALHAGHSVVVRSASDLLGDLVKQESSAARTRRLSVYVQPALLCIDEVGYLSYDARHADLLFEVVTRRYEKNRSIVLTTNKPFAEWPQTFPNAACVVTLVDRLLHRAEIVTVEADSYRFKEAEQRQKERAQARKRKSATAKV